MTILVVPPPNLVLIALAGLVLMRWRWYRRAGTIIVAVSLVLLLVLSLPITGQSLLVSLEQGLPLTPPADAPPQAIVILSAEVEHTIGPGPDVRVGPLTLQRLRAGAALYRRTHLPILVSGGTLQKGRAADRRPDGRQPEERFWRTGAVGRSTVARHLGKRIEQRCCPDAAGNSLGVRGDPCLA